MPKNKVKKSYNVKDTQVLTPFYDGFPPEKLDSYYLDRLLPYQEIEEDNCQLGVKLNLLKRVYEQQVLQKICHSRNQNSLDISLIKGVHDIFSGKLLAVRQPSIKKERIPSVVIPPEMKLFSGFYVLNNYFPYYPKRIRACFSLDLPAVHFKEIHEDYFKSLNQFLFHDFSDQLQYRYKLLLLCGMMFWVDQQDKREISILNQAIDNLLKLESIVNLSIFNHPILPDILPEYNTPSIFPSPFHCLVRVEKCMPPPYQIFFIKYTRTLTEIIRV